MEVFPSIFRDSPAITMATDASMEGWGACCMGVRTGGLFSAEEREAIAVYFGLKALCSSVSNNKVLTDNTSAVGAINWTVKHSNMLWRNIDLFASRINIQLPRFAAYRPDPEAETINAFSIQWTNLKFYAFPPPFLVWVGCYRK